LIFSPKTYLILYHPSLGNLTTHITITLHLAAFSGKLSSAQWLVGHGIDPQAVDENKLTAKDVAKMKDEREVVDFLDKVDSMEGLFPLKEVSPMNFHAISGDADGLIKYICINAENQTSDSDANQEVITYISFILETELIYELVATVFFS
jgi:ankyrin repeat protein